MPLGNGDLALNVWVEKNGDLLLLLAKSDAWDENSILLKLGRVRVTFDPPLPVEEKFEQTLDPRAATIHVRAGDAQLKIWVDANAPVIHVEGQSALPRAMSAVVELWRTEPREVKPHTGDLFCNLTGPPLYPTVISLDQVFPAKENCIAWCHHNAPREDDPYTINLKLQGLAEAQDSMAHPLLQRAFGAAMEGDGLESRGDASLVSAHAETSHHLRIHALTLHPASPDVWRDAIEKQVESDCPANYESHLKWWAEFWNRSWIFVSDQQVTRAYLLQRFMNACAGRGEFPIKHNGSLFSVGRDDDPDFRRWGGAGFWFMNQRLIYWPMLMSGDFDLMKPWLKMYLRSSPLQKMRTKRYFNHDGAHFPETITFWGAEISSHYGWTPFEQRARPEAECPYLTNYWSGAIELTLILLEYALYTNDVDFARQSLAALAREVMTFFNLHYPRDASGKIRFEPAQALETWHDATNPTPEIAGLRYVLRRLLDLPRDWVSNDDRTLYQSLLRQMPDLPVGEKDGVAVILPAERFDKMKNRENPELYCVFPYRLFGVDKPDLQLARNTFEKRINVSHTCWSQDDIHLALLGMTEGAKENLMNRSSEDCHSDSRFPAFWNAFSDWRPDIDHGGVLQLALQLMLMQCEGRTILLLPAWPSDWDARFKLHAPWRTTVEGEVRKGRLVSLVVNPPERRRDVRLLDGSPLP